MLSPSELRTLLRYNPETGELFWKKRDESQFATLNAARTWTKRFSEKLAFQTVDTHGYLRGGIGGRQYSAHRVIWAIVHGEWPAEQTDHINGVRTDNRLVNLRAVSQNENSKNRKLRAGNAVGVTGVDIHKGQYRAKISIDGQQRHVGYFKTLAEAAAARKVAEVKYGYHPNHGRS